MDLIPKMGEMGFYAPNLEGYGLPGVSETAYGLLMRELEARATPGSARWRACRGRW